MCATSTHSQTSCAAAAAVAIAVELEFYAYAALYECCTNARKLTAEHTCMKYTSYTSMLSCMYYTCSARGAHANGVLWCAARE